MMQAVVFDMDGVIFDSENLLMSCWKKIGLKYGISQIEENYKRCLGTNSTMTRRIFMEQYGEDFPYDLYKKEASDLFHKIADNGGLDKKPGIEELLIYLKEEGYRIGLASSTRLEIVEKELKPANLYAYFDTVVGGDLVEKSKPEPDIFLETCRRLFVEPVEAYAVEDSYNGIRAANKAGMKPLMVLDLMEPTMEMKALSYLIADSLHDVKKFLEESKSVD